MIPLFMNRFQDEHTSSADQVGKFVGFDVGGNKYRLAAFILYKIKRLYIRHVLTHSEYNKQKWKEDHGSRI